MNEIEEQAVEALNTLLDRVSSIELADIEREPIAHDKGIDFLVHVRANASNREHVLVCEVKNSGQPRHVRSAILQLRNFVAHFGQEATGIFIAPYLSPESQALCEEHDVGFLDLQGNARIVFDNVFIERLVGNAPPAEKRELKSLFRPKAAQVLLVMLRDPNRAWRVAELAERADVSLGHVSNVRNGLLDREWARLETEGISLIKPDALLNAWRDEYEMPVGRRRSFYTTLHGSAFGEAVQKTCHRRQGDGVAVLASFSAAQWLAPYGRVGTHFFYADDAGLEVLTNELRLSSASKGENVVVTIPKDTGLLYDTVEPASDIVCTSPVRTYLDLSISGERGQEAADHLRRKKLTWLN